MRADPPKPHFYCPEGQTIAVERFLRAWQVPMSKFTLHAVREHAQVAGVRDGMFVYVEGHPRKMSTDLVCALRAYGFNMIRIDDSYARERWHAENHEERL